MDSNIFMTYIYDLYITYFGFKTHLIVSVLMFIDELV